MKNWIKAVFIFVIFSGTILFPKIIEARSGCCSHHGGVCGCGCCDGTGLSSTCTPYYPNCNGGGNDVVIVRPTSTPKSTSTPRPTRVSIIAPTNKPTVKPTKRPTTIPTKRPTPTIKPTATSTPTLTPTKIPSPTIATTLTSTINQTVIPTIEITPTITPNLTIIPTPTSAPTFWQKIFRFFGRK